MDLTVVILNFNTRDLLKKCLKSIFDNKFKRDIQVAVVDNGSEDGSAEMVNKEFPKVKLVKSEKNLGFAGGNNLGLKGITSKYYLLLNSDTVVTEGALDYLVDFMDRASYGISSCKLLNKDGSLQPNAGDLPKVGPVFFWLSGLDDILSKAGLTLPSFHNTSKQFYNGEKEVGWVSGSVMMIKGEVLQKIGFLDDKIFMYGEDVDYCVRAGRAGFKIGWTEGARIYHLGGGSLQNPSFSQWLGEFRGLLYLYKKNYGDISAFGLRLLIYIFVAVRILVFSVLGKSKVVGSYAKIITNL